jgi:cytochrome c oxidase accessory protein FixG
LAYIIGSEALFGIITDPPSQHLAGLASITVFSGVFYGVFAKFREQVCTTVCPYGRLQGVMLDRNSVVVAYDRVRGEARGKFKKGEDRSAVQKGDCIDCGHCVHVCPTGIDIRNGTQLECINCTACIDACDEMMDAVNLPRRLIRYTSEHQIQTREPFKLNVRAKAYSVLLVLLLGVLVSLVVTRTQIEANILRTPGMLFQTTEDGKISNLYSYKIINKTNNDMRLDLRSSDSRFTLKLVGELPELPPQEVIEGAFFIVTDETVFEKGKADVKLGVYNQNGELIEMVKIGLMGPL